VLERVNFADALAAGTLWSSALREGDLKPPRVFDPARLLQEEEVNRSEDVIRVLLHLYLSGGVSPEARAKLVAFLAEGQPSGSALDRRVREVVYAILTMAEYQLA
jgi:hypothetical protein